MKRTPQVLSLVLGVIVGIAAVALLLDLTGCSASAVKRQAVAADVIGRTLNGALPSVLEAYKRQQLDVAEIACGHVVPCADPEAARDAVTAVRAKWAPVWLAWELSRAAHDAWADQLDRCQRDVDAGDCAPSLAGLAATAVEHATELRCALRAVGVSDPLPGVAACGKDGGL